MVQQIDSLDTRIARLLGDEELGVSEALPSSVSPAGSGVEFEKNIFDDMLSRAVEALNGVSQTEKSANQIIEKYTRGEVGLQEAMVAASQMSIMVQMATTIIT